MANNRFQLKQFAQNADNNGVFGSYSAGTAESSSDPETIQSLPAWLTGWLNATTSASILPRLEEMQGLQFVLCKAILENTKEGIPSWLATETYYKYSVCSYYDDTHPFDIYINKTGTYTATNPAEDTANWVSGGDFFRDKIIPDQSGNDGKVLTTDGINIGWEAAPGGQAVGQIIQMLCTPDYIPSGCLPCDGSEYAKEQFSDLWDNYLTAATPLLNTCTYAEYASDISTYGQCAKFGVDTVNNKFKVPTIKDGSYITQALSDGELGKSYNESLPNITGTFGGIQAHTVGASGCIKNTGAVAANYYYDAANAANFLLDASLSSSTYQDGANVQGNNVRMRFFVVVANGQINQTDFDWAAWQSSLSSKANTSMNNITTAGKNTIVGWGIPDYEREISITPNSPFVAPFDGIVEIYCEYSSNLGWAFIAGNENNVNKTIIGGAQSGATTVISGGQAIIVKGQNYHFAITGTVKRAIICPFKGVN